MPSHKVRSNHSSCCPICSRLAHRNLDRERRPCAHPLRRRAPSRWPRCLRRDPRIPRCAQVRVQTERELWAALAKAASSHIVTLHLLKPSSRESASCRRLAVTAARQGPLRNDVGHSTRLASMTRAARTFGSPKPNARSTLPAPPSRRASFFRPAPALLSASSRDVCVHNQPRGLCDACWIKSTGGSLP